MGMAHKVSMNARKLPQGFRERYGGGPFTTLKNYRLDQARLALVESACNSRQRSRSKSRLLPGLEFDILDYPSPRIP